MRNEALTGAGPGVGRRRSRGGQAAEQKGEEGEIMEPNQSEHVYTVLFDEQREGWFVRSGSSGRIPLSRVSLGHLISLYNDIHHGAPLTLIERRAMEKLGQERRDLQETVRSLYDYIDAQAERYPSLGRRLGHAIQSIWQRLR